MVMCLMNIPTRWIVEMGDLNSLVFLFFFYSCQAVEISACLVYTLDLANDCLKIELSSGDENISYTAYAPHGL